METESVYSKDSLLSFEDANGVGKPIEIPLRTLCNSVYKPIDIDMMYERQVPIDGVTRGAPGNKREDRFRVLIFKKSHFPTIVNKFRAPELPSTNKDVTLQSFLGKDFYNLFFTET
jgi:hypothetical protein